MIAQLQAQVWVEYVESAANISDDISRSGLSSKVITDLGCVVRPLKVDLLCDLVNLPFAEVLALIKATNGQS